MTEEERRKHNAHRLAGAIYDRSEDPACIQRLASALDYNQQQLQRDMVDLIHYIWELESRLEGDRDN